MSVDDYIRRQARDEFADMLRSGDTSEAQWHRFFDAKSFVLTENLPVRVSALYSQIRMDSGRPDYVFIEPSGAPTNFGYFGVVELKRPDQKILRVYSSRHLVPSSPLTTATTQAGHYLDDLREGRVADHRISMVLGHAGYAFIVLGRTQEVLAKCHNEFLRGQFRRLLPVGFQVIPYDYLFERLEVSINLPIHVVVLSDAPRLAEDFTHAREECTRLGMVCTDCGGEFRPDGSIHHLPGCRLKQDRYPGQFCLDCNWAGNEPSGVCPECGEGGLQAIQP